MMLTATTMQGGTGRQEGCSTDHVWMLRVLEEGGFTDGIGIDAIVLLEANRA